MKKWLSLEVISQKSAKNIISSPLSNNSLDVDLILNDSNTDQFKSSSFTQKSSFNKGSSMNRFQSVNDVVKANMQNVLNDIKNLDQSRVLADTEHGRRTSVPAIKVEMEPTIKSFSDLNDKIVKKLKEKFENKDQTFVKVSFDLSTIEQIII